MPDVSPLLERRREETRVVAIYLCGEDCGKLIGQHFYSGGLLSDRVNNGVDLYPGDESLSR